MASLLLKGDSYYYQFYYPGRRFTVTVGPVGKDEAEGFAGNVGTNLRRIKQNLITVPPGMDIGEALRHSFIPACASKGVEQRLIDEWKGQLAGVEVRAVRRPAPGAFTACRQPAARAAPRRWSPRRRPGHGQPNR
jgi:hypothetical protein